MAIPSEGSSDPTPDPQQPTLGTLVRRAFITGAALVLPVVVTIILLAFIVDFLSQFLRPLTDVLRAAGVSTKKPWHLQVLTLALLAGFVFAVGFVAERSSGETPQFADGFDDFMAAIPGVGTIYSSARQVSEVLFQSDTDSFQEVKLVEFPTDDVYMIAFLTAEPHEAIPAAVGEEDMITMFLPLAPNPFMGGFLINVPDERVYDVDISVEEGVRSIVTSGVASGESDSHEMSMGDLKERIENSPYSKEVVEQFSWPDAVPGDYGDRSGTDGDDGDGADANGGPADADDGVRPN